MFKALLALTGQLVKVCVNSTTNYTVLLLLFLFFFWGGGVKKY